MTVRNATAAVIGAGDFIGAAIARKFAAEGFTVFAGRRNGDKLAPLIAEIEAAGGQAFGRSLDARKEDDITAFLQEADARGAAGGLHLQRRRQRQLPAPRDDRAGVPQGLGDGLLRGLPRRPRGGAADAAARPGLRSSSPAPPPACAAASATPPSPRAKFGLRAVAQAAWRASSGRKNIHVAHLVIDAGVDTAWVRERIKAREGAEALAELDPGRLMQPASIAESLLGALPTAARRLDARNSTSAPSARNGDAMPKVEFLFDFGSPNAYLSHLVIPGHREARTGATFDYVPVLLGGVFKLTGNRSPAEAFAGIRNKPDYREARDRALRPPATASRATSPTRSSRSTR